LDSNAVLACLEAISCDRPDRVLRIRGELPMDSGGNPSAGGGRFEAFELLVFRGFSSSVTHPTAFDPDVPALPAGSTIESAELLQGPLTPGDDQLIAGPEPVARFLQPEGWA
jgi:hypothetical protein